MTKITPTGKAMGAIVTDIDLSKPLSDVDFAKIVLAMGEHGVLCFPKQEIDARALKSFSEKFGKLQFSVSDAFCEPGMPEVSILSNVIENGKPIGIADAGQDWHTDMSYNATIGFTNVLYALMVPRRDGKPLGNTTFANMDTAYRELDPALKKRLEGMTATHDFNKFWEEMRRRPGSARAPLTPEQRAQRPPSVHPIFMTHPITGRKILYCNPGYAIRINELDEAESDRILDILFKHQLQEKYQYSHVWTEKDVLMWDHIGTLHNAIPDYKPNEYRLMKRCQVAADMIFKPEFMQKVRAAAKAA